jgi:hypothetical protein
LGGIDLAAVLKDMAHAVGMETMYRGDEEDNDDRAFLTGFDRIDAKAAKRNTHEKRKKHLLSAFELSYPGSSKQQG